MNIRIILKKEIVYKNGKSPLFLRFTHHKKSKFISLGLALLPEFWNAAQQSIDASYPNYKEIQFEIDRKIKEYEKR